MLPIGVIIPIRDSMSLLPRHVESMRHWIDLVEEIIVVDSNSQDGSMEYLRRELAGLPVRFFDHPPGLYQSWNFGIRQVTSRYTYVSTVGDDMTRDGLIHLADVAQRHDCDVVISPPEFVDNSGRPVRSNAWPVHDILAMLQLENEIYLEGLLTFVLALTFLPFAILGSSASNLYRTAVLQMHPFPTEYGMNGDGAGGLFNALHIRLGITPRRISSFRKHPKPYSLSDYLYVDGDRRMLEAGLVELHAAMNTRSEIKTEAGRMRLDQFIRAKIVVQQWRSSLIAYRARTLPWFFNPVAWYARYRRNVAQRDCEALVATLLESMPKDPEWDTVRHRIAPLVAPPVAPPVTAPVDPVTS